ncbi:phosphodiesterase [Mycolicibacterium frederiksbergense]|uniref:Phosphodiesterase n=1 Tax=Mycolicibacterium frederiksbergense TaxID=117567 RepID=A0A6H0SA91_9MYCO|nr:phosphodiesterase [Mycolicibacterium frederiksbergense]
MGYAKHIGRVGALAVTLGVGVALASAPTAFAETGDSSSSSSSSSSTSSASSSNTGSSSTSSDSSSSSTSGQKTTRSARSAAGSGSGAITVPLADRTSPVRAKTARTAKTSPLSAGAPAEPAVTLITIPVNPAAPLVNPDPGTPPVEAPAALAALGAVRDELERNTLRRNATSGPQVGIASVDTPNVLVIGVDGANLSRVLADPANVNFFSLIQGSSTAPSSIVGHTTISNPSWSTILTGNWGETTGVINNIFTPWTYNRWSTVFNQLEEDHDDGIQTTAVANWDVIAAIAAAGGDLGADLVRYIGKREDDPNWLKTDDAVGDTTELIIAGSNPDVANFVFSYFVGVDENGHAYGGASEEYKLALNNFDRNLGEIMAAVEAWETANNEEWTIVLVTDHGHQPQRGLGHGFQSPDETETFVIVNGPGFTPGAINLQYQIVDVTPTVVTLFGGTPRASDGTSMTELTNNVIPINNDAALREALQDLISKNGYPDTITNISLGVRTIFTSIPYFLVDIVDGIVGGIKSVAAQNIPIVSLLAGLAVGPVQFIGDLGYVATNFVAQVVARITGVTGASIYPFWPPAAPDFPSYTPPAPPSMLAGLQVCGDPALGACVDPSIAV